MYISFHRFCIKLVCFVQHVSQTFSLALAGSSPAVVQLHFHRHNSGIFFFLVMSLVYLAGLLIIHGSIAEVIQILHLLLFLSLRLFPVLLFFFLCFLKLFFYHLFHGLCNLSFYITDLFFIHSDHGFDRIPVSAACHDFILPLDQLLLALYQKIKTPLHLVCRRYLYPVFPALLAVLPFSGLRVLHGLPVHCLRSHLNTPSGASHPHSACLYIHMLSLAPLYPAFCSWPDVLDQYKYIYL